MLKKDKVLVVTVARNNNVLLEHQFSAIKKFNPGYDCDFVIVDNSSDDIKHLQLLDKLAKTTTIKTVPNGRAESSFNFIWKNNKDYKYYFLMHEDCCPNKDNWLKVFIDRVNSNYIEDVVKNTDYKNLSIGRVGATHQPWRSYTSILGYSVQCIFLKHCLSFLYNKVPEMFKYCDGDRVLLTGECLDSTDGLKSLVTFEEMKKNLPEKFNNLCEILHQHLRYPDDGIPPYPAGECWNKLTLLTEFINNIEPLINGFRVVGLEGDGFLEQITGYDVPWGHNFVHHYNAPNMKEFLANKFNTDAKEITKQLKNKIFLLKTDKIIKEYYKEKNNGKI